MVSDRYVIVTTLFRLLLPNNMMSLVPNYDVIMTSLSHHMLGWVDFCLKFMQSKYHNNFSWQRIP